MSRKQKTAEKQTPPTMESQVGAMIGKSIVDVEPEKLHPAPAGETVSLEEVELPMPGVTMRACPICGQPMRQEKKVGPNRYFYCRGFGEVPACSCPGVAVGSKEYHRQVSRLEVGTDVWVFNEKDRRYHLITVESETS